MKRQGRHQTSRSNGPNAWRCGLWLSAGLLAASPVAAVAALPTSECTAGPLGAPCRADHPGLQINPAAGNPVHLATGNKYQLAVDMPARPTSPCLALVRHYNSLDPRMGPFGKGWSHTYATHLYWRGSRAQLVRADGTRLVFDCPSAGACATRQGQDRLTCLDASAMVAAGDSARGRNDPLRTRRTERAMRRHARPPSGRACTTWRWETPAGQQHDFNPQGQMIAIGPPGAGSAPLVRIERHATGPWAGLIKRVDGGKTGHMSWHYTSTPAGARVQRIVTPIGAFDYTYEQAPEGTSPPWSRLVATTRPDGLGHRYYYDTRHQAGHADALTGIGLQRKGVPWRLQTWRLDAARRVVGLSWGDDDRADTLRLDYADSAPEGNDTKTTRVSGAAGQTRMTFVRRAGTWLLARTTGAPCPGCAAPGLAASYDPAGRLVSINGTRVTYDVRGAISMLAVENSGWPGLRLRYTADGYRSQWSFDEAQAERRTLADNGHAGIRQFANGTRWRWQHGPGHHTLRLTQRHGRREVVIRLSETTPGRIQVDHPAERQTIVLDAGRRPMSRIILRSAAPHAFRGAGQAGAVTTPHRHVAETALPSRTHQLSAHYTYDRAGRLIEHALPEGGTLRYGRTPDGRTASIQWRAAGGRWRALVASASDGTAGYRQANGLYTRGLTTGGQLRALIVHDPRSPSEPFAMQVLDHDARGRITSEGFLLPARDAAAHATPRQWIWQDYAYDAQNRLSEARTVDPTSPLPRISHYTWHASGRRDGPSAAPPAATLRDPSGLPRQYAGRRLTYGPDHRLVEVADTTGTRVRYGHNAFGERIWRHAEGRTTYFVFEQGRVTLEYELTAHAQPRFLRRYVYADKTPIALLDYTTSPPAIYSIHADALGAPWIVTDGERRVAWMAYLDATGQATRLVNRVDMPLRLPGQWFDAATGWHDNYLRTYDPAQGHYLEPDPLGPLPDNDAFGYAAQQPRRHADPLGLMLFAFDGTRNGPQSETNVSRFARLYADEVHYVAGPGDPERATVDGITARSAPAILLTQWERLLASLRAAPRARHTIDLVGYSRGAALARAFGNRIVQQLRNGRFHWRDSAGTISACVDLRFMGLFDTVKQFGILGSDDADVDTRIAAQWAWVAHAVALNERRWYFPLTVLGVDGPNRQEAAFLGAHADIGGGYLDLPAPQDGITPGELSAVALAWMRWQATHAGLQLAPPPRRPRADQARLHDARSPSERRAHYSDRLVRRGDDTLEAASQDQHPAFGSALRREVERFVERDLFWTFRPGAAVGTVDLRRYGAWLRRHLGLFLNQLRPVRRFGL